MRIRRKPWAKQELEEAKFYIDDPIIYKGEWKQQFEDSSKPLYLEIGCGKGSFISKIASRHQENNYIAADMIEAMLGLSKRNIETEYANNNLEVKNLLLIRMNAERILDIFAENDTVERIYINFCNPWPKDRHAKRRLTCTNFLRLYDDIFRDKCHIIMKTDNVLLFDYSLDSLTNYGYEIKYMTRDLDCLNKDNIMTEYESKFYNKGVKINKLEGIK